MEDTRGTEVRPHGRRVQVDGVVGDVQIRQRARGGKIDAPHSIRRAAGGRRLQISDQVIKDVVRRPAGDNDAVRSRASASRRQIADLVLEDVLSRRHRQGLCR